MLTIKKKLAPTWFKMPGPEPAAEFLLAPLSSMAWLDMRNEIHRSAQGEITVSGKGAMAAVQESVRDWRNVLDESGQSIDFDRKLLAEFPSQVLMDLATEIGFRSILLESERKN